MRLLLGALALLAVAEAAPVGVKRAAHQAHVLSPHETHSAAETTASAASPTLEKKEARVRVPAVRVTGTVVRKPSAVVALDDPVQIGPRKCISHDIFTAMSDGMSIARGSVATWGGGTGEETFDVIVMVIVGLASLLLLVFGTRFMTASLATIVILVTLIFVLGLVDGFTFHDGATTADDFSICILPLLIAAAVAIVAATLVLCLLQKLAWLSFFCLGAALGALGMYSLRSIILAAAPTVARSPYFAWYWAGCAVVVLVAGLLAAYTRHTIYAVTCIGAPAAPHPPTRTHLRLPSSSPPSKKALEPPVRHPRG
jgi:hypothetical protein